MKSIFKLGLASIFFSLSLGSAVAQEKGYTRGIHKGLQSALEIRELDTLSPLYDSEVKARLDEMKKSAEGQSHQTMMKWTTDGINRDLRERRIGIHVVHPEYFFLPGFSERADKYYDDLVAEIKKYVLSFEVRRPRTVTLSWVMQLHQILRAVRLDPSPYYAYLRAKPTEEQTKRWHAKRLKTRVYLKESRGKPSLDCSSDSAAECVLRISFLPDRQNDEFKALTDHYFAYRRNYGYEKKPDSPWDSVRQNIMGIWISEDTINYWTANTHYSTNEDLGIVLLSTRGKGSLRYPRKSRIVTSLELDRLFARMRN